MSKWNGKLECIKHYETYSSPLTKGKIYEVKNGRFQYDDKYYSAEYEDYADLIDGNPDFENILIELMEKEEVIQCWGIKETKTVRYITINDEVTIAMPMCDIGITVKHPDDEYHEETGQAIALKRLYEKIYN